ADQVQRHEAAECVVRLARPIAFDTVSDIFQLARFVLVDNHEIAGGGIVLKELHDSQERIRQQVFKRNYKWERSSISAERRGEAYKQQPALVIFTGLKDSGKKPLAKALEKKLIENGRVAYFLGIGNVLYGVDADIKRKHSAEHLRRLAEISNLMLDAGVILLVTAISLTEGDVRLIRLAVDPDKVMVFWVGEKPDRTPHCEVINSKNVEHSVNLVETKLREKGIIP
ncbi:MAG TPA: adenylyl-sulfate kinase, partial [Elusimicrobiales bacterium]|nr:adenylyl-sulfate kinase [Elusimicrobiales bacterium]